MSYTYIRMTRCSIGRSFQKNVRSGGGVDLSDILDARGDIIYADANVNPENLTIGLNIGDVLTIVAPGTLGWQTATVSGGSVGNFQGVTTNGPVTDITVTFANPSTSFITSSNAIINGNVTAESFLGDGTKLSGIALNSDLSSNVVRIDSLEHTTNDIITRITPLEQANVRTVVDIESNASRIHNLETAVLISNSYNINSGFISGDIIYASANNTLNRFGIGSDNHVLKAVDGFPSWEPELIKDWSSDGNKIYYSKGPVGISNVNELGTQTLQIGSNVVIDDSAINTVLVSGNIYISKNLTVIDEISCNKITAAEQLSVKKQIISATRPPSERVIRF